MLMGKYVGYLMLYPEKRIISNFGNSVLSKCIGLPSAALSMITLVSITVIKVSNRSNCKAGESFSSEISHERNDNWVSNLTLLFCLQLIFIFI